MYKVIEAVAKSTYLPAWWVEAIAIEYTDCREFATRNEIWTFNFDRVSQASLEQAVQSHRTIVQGPVIHNIHKAVFSDRTLLGLISNIPVPIVLEPDDAIAEGPISDYSFNFNPNPIDVWDPKLNFDRYFQVRDSDGLWQWHVADFVSVEGRSYGKWVSSEVDLEPLDQIHERLASLRNPVIKPCEPGHADFKSKVESFYQWLDEIRRPVLLALADVHAARRSARQDLSKATKGIPPILSRFESFTVRNNEIYSRFFAAPVFFSASREHAIRAETLASSVKGDRELVQKLDELYQERATAIIIGVACLEAFINSVGFEHFPKVWTHIEKLSVLDKWQLFLVLKDQGSLFARDKQPYQFLVELMYSRNYLVHFKTEYNKVKPCGNRLASHVEYHWMPRKLVRDLPVRLPQLIKDFCQATGVPVPTWLTPHPGLGWLK